ncbi:hypothetical protein KO561_14280 [Radiobacillus kanasensis]|uniref:hypothetical protein n=1 Tax=Radiobacillus kanasensis TaxID=2844358 RepID=UPI001E5A3746|nr:hypothetical protein [Radiobacillus kanasensis]UFT98361.1 hypothetical protein KO561_14280 [Radiobacillus kanasensis]
MASKELLKAWVPFITGVFLVEILMSNWQNEPFNWNFAVNLSIAGMIGSSIGIVLRKVFKNEN